MLFYFIILRYINNGIVHFYFLLSLVLGYFSVNKVSSRIRKIFKHWFLLGECAIIFVQVRIMSRKLTKKSKRRVLLISVVTISLISLIVVNIFSVWKQLLEKREEKLFYTEELEKLKEEEEKKSVAKYKAGKLVIDLDDDNNKEFINSFKTCANREIFVGE